MRTLAWVRVPALCLAASWTAGCGSDHDTHVATSTEPVGAETIHSSVDRSTESASTGDVATLTNDNLAFALDLFHAIAPEGNFIASPHSISTALAMTYAGARTTTHDEMASTLHFALPEPALHAAFNTVNQALDARDNVETDAGGKPFELHLANAAWPQRGETFLQTYLDTLERYYGAGLFALDYAADPEAARAVINGWVSDQTQAKIPELLQKGDVDSLVRLVLTNAVYFYGSWLTAFQTSSTSSGAFNKLDGSTVTASMMHRTVAEVDGEEYASGEGWQALDLPYVGDQVSMTLILPAAGTFESFVSALDGNQLATILDALAPVSSDGVSITLPKFQAKSRVPLNSTLQTMGMTTAFTADADFSGMDGQRDLYISEVLHEATIQVDEAGTEATAATAVILRGLAIATSIAFTADRPFLFVLRDRPTGAVLFLGQVTDPSAAQ